jgi:hypothetical protein
MLDSFKPDGSTVITNDFCGSPDERVSMTGENQDSDGRSDRESAVEIINDHFQDS